MKKIHLATLSPFILFMVACFSFTAFTDPKGGESVEIYLDDKLVLRQFIGDASNAKQLSLAPADKQKELRIFYNHCGKVGKDRRIYIKNKQGELLHTWKYANDNKKWMHCKVNKIPVKKGEPVRLYYASKEIPGGIMIANIRHTNSNDQALP